MSTQVVWDDDGKRVTREVVKRDAVTSRTVVTHTTVAPKPVKTVKVKRDELAEAVKYAKQFGQPDTVVDTRSYRERMKHRLMNAPERPDPLPKSLVGRTWKVGDLTATILSDDGHVVEYTFGAVVNSTPGKMGSFAPKHSISRDRALANVEARKLPTRDAQENRPYDAEAPRLRKATSDFSSTRPNR